MQWNDEVARRDYASVETRKHIQLRRLQDTVQTLYNHVPFYHQALDERDVTPRDIRTLRDLQLLPFTTREDLDQYYPFGLMAVPNDQIACTHASPGVAGKVRIVGYTRHDMATWGEIYARALSCAGLYPHDRLFNAYGYSLPFGGLGFHYGAEYLGLTEIPPAGNCVERQLSMLQDLQVTGICCTPYYALMLIEDMKQHHTSRRELSLRSAIFNIEQLTDEMRIPIAQGLGLTVLSIYGFSEVIGSAIAMECIPEGYSREGEHDLHIFEDHFLPEVIDPTTGEQLPDGEDGELVITTLTQEGMPLLRYRTGDICALTTAPCACGRTLTRMSQIKGHVDDILNIRGINVNPHEIENVLQSISHLTPSYQLIVERHHAQDETTLQVEVTPQFQQQVACDVIDQQHWQSNREVAQLEQTIQRRVQDMLDLPIKAQVLAAGSLPDSDEQTMRVLDKRYKQQRIRQVQRPFKPIKHTHIAAIVPHSIQAVQTVQTDPPAHESTVAARPTSRKGEPSHKSESAYRSEPSHKGESAHKGEPSRKSEKMGIVASARDKDEDATEKRWL